MAKLEEILKMSLLDKNLGRAFKEVCVAGEATNADGKPIADFFFIKNFIDEIPFKAFDVLRCVSNRTPAPEVPPHNAYYVCGDYSVPDGHYFFDNYHLPMTKTKFYNLKTDKIELEIKCIKDIGVMITRKNEGGNIDCLTISIGNQEHQQIAAFSRADSKGEFHHLTFERNYNSDERKAEVFVTVLEDNDHIADITMPDSIEKDFINTKAALQA